MLTIVLLAGTGVVVADGADYSPSGCDSVPREERVGPLGLSLEIQPGSYLFVPQGAHTGDAEKAGFWDESNRRDGLQTQACFKYGGLVRVYSGDTHQGLAVP